MKNYLFAILALFTYNLAACQQTPQTAFPSERQAVMEDPKPFAESIKQAGVQLLDVRTPKEYEGGNIAGSMHADWNNREEFLKRTAHLNKNNPVYLYCLSGGRSAAAAELLLEQGFSKVVNLNGGINAWQQAGLPLTPPLKDVKPMTAAEYKTLVDSSKWVLVDFGADWCPPCVKIKPAVDNFLSKHPEIKKLMLDPMVNKELAAANKATSLPTFILYKSGKEIFRREGIFDVAELEKVIQ
jgi:rhodanese-related sulfurtransferase